MPYLQDGDIISAAEVAAPGNDVRTIVNNIADADLGPGCLTMNHLPGLLTDVYTLFTNGLTAGFSRVGRAPADPWIGYANYIGTTPYDYQLFAMVAPTPPYGAPGAAAEGWRIPQNPVTLERTEIPTANARIDTYRYKGVHVTGSVNVGSLSGDLYSDVGQGLESYSLDHGLFAAIGWADGGGTRHVAARSIRGVSQKNKKQNLTVQYFLQQADLDTADGKMQAIFLVVAKIGIRAYYGAVSGGTHTIAGARISALPMHAEVLT